jgi:hypothetical protein
MGGQLPRAQVVHGLWAQIGSEPRIVGDGDGGLLGTTFGVDGQGGNPESMAGGSFTGDGGVGRCAVDVGESIGAGFQRIAGILQSGDVNDGQLLAEMRGGDGRGKGLAIEGGTVEAESAAIVLDQLDVVGAFGDAGIDERLGILGPGERGDRDPELGAVAAGGGDESAGGAQVGATEAFAGVLLRAHDGGHRLKGEHIEVGRDSEGQGGLEVFGRLNVGVGIDEAGEEALARGVDDVRAGGRHEVRTNRLNFAVDDEDGGAREHSDAIEDAGVLNESGLSALEHRGGRQQQA